jgi:hypothetical protein
MKIINFIAVIMVAMHAIYPQTAASQPNAYEYAYDGAGNRIKREMVTIPPRLADTSKVYQSTFNNIDVRIYPNPTAGNLAVELSNMEGGSTVLTQIFDMNGKLMTEKTSNGEKTEMDIGSQPQGNYIMRITINKKRKEWTIVKM